MEYNKASLCYWPSEMDRISDFVFLEIYRIMFGKKPFFFPRIFIIRYEQTFSDHLHHDNLIGVNYLIADYFG